MVQRPPQEGAFFDGSTGSPGAVRGSGPHGVLLIRLPIERTSLLGFQGSVSSGVARGLLRAACVAGWRYPPKEEVPVSHSCSMQGLLIVENAG